MLSCVIMGGDAGAVGCQLSPTPLFGIICPVSVRLISCVIRLSQVSSEANEPALGSYKVIH